MRRASLFAFVGLLAFAASAGAQHYDLYYVMPGETGGKGVDVGLISSDISSIGDVSIVPVMAKYSVNDQIELGARANLGLLHDSADDLSTIEVGGKYGLKEGTALTAAFLVPTGDADDPGLSIGAMHTVTSGGLMINNWLQVGLLDGYTGGDGVNLGLLVEPTMALGDKLTGYLDVLVNTNTDDIGDNLGVNLGPNVDLMLGDMAVVNAGVTIGIAGDAKQDDVGLVAALILGL